MIKVYKPKERGLEVQSTGSLVDLFDRTLEKHPFELKGVKRNFKIMRQEEMAVDVFERAFEIIKDAYRCLQETGRLVFFSR